MAADVIAMAGAAPGAGPRRGRGHCRFRATLAARDIVPPESIIADGGIHRRISIERLMAMINGLGSRVEVAVTLRRAEPRHAAAVA